MKLRLLVPAVLAVLVFIHGATTSPYFVDFRYLLDRSSLYVETGLLALAMTLVIVSGQIDLSVAATLALVACVTARMMEANVPWVVAIPVGIGLGVFLGWINGILIARFKLPSFMVTLGTMAAYRGAAQAMVGSESAKVPPSLIGIDMITVPGTPVPVPLVLLLGLAILTGLVLHRTSFGRRIEAIGTNERAAFYAGVPTVRVTVAVFAIAGGLAGLSGMIMSSRLGVSRFDHGLGLEVDAITAVVLGGADIAGGSGTIAGTMLALLLLGLLRTDLGIANVTAEYQLAAVGALLVFAILLNNFLSSRKRAKLGAE